MTGEIDSLPGPAFRDREELGLAAALDGFSTYSQNVVARLFYAGDTSGFRGM
ncbi:hypothetical protein [Cyclobacterium jeungdonense]|uniref:hypothetical protein n=1 Tax=Cyclobacterium jeungdonense TaxID=708087 RepID=UPI0013D0D1EC|nr:hypothetical protein [Cyclobacterium jeungdonense]